MRKRRKTQNNEENANLERKKWRQKRYENWNNKRVNLKKRKYEFSTKRKQREHNMKGQRITVGEELEGKRKKERRWNKWKNSAQSRRLECKEGKKEKQFTTRIRQRWEEN